LEKKSPSPNPPPPTFPKRKNIEMYTKKIPKKSPKIPIFVVDKKIVGNKTPPWPW
jgi:hypothetical protein